MDSPRWSIRRKLRTKLRTHPSEQTQLIKGMNELTAYYLLGSGKGFTAIATIAADMSSQAKVMFKKKYKIDAEICETILTLSVDDIVTEPRFLVSSRIKHKA